MFRRVGLLATMLLALTLLAPNVAQAREHEREHHHHRVRLYFGYGPTYHYNGYYDRWGYWHPYGPGFYDRWGRWHPY